MDAINKIILVDHYFSGHHLFYANILIKHMTKKNMKISAIGSKGFIEGILSRGLGLEKFYIVDYAVTNYRYLRLLINEYRKIQFVKEVLSICKANNYEDVHFLYVDDLIIALGVNVVFRRNKHLNILIGTLHGPHYFQELTACSFKSLAIRIINAINVSFLRLTSFNDMKYIVHSNSLVDLLKSNGVANASYVPYPTLLYPCANSVNAKRIRLRMRSTLRVDNAKVLMLLFGGTRFNKGADLALQALKQLPDSYHLFIVGKEEYFTMNFFLAMSDKLNLNNRIHFDLRHVSDDDIVNYFFASDLLLLPYRKGFIGQSGPLTIAASVGLPVITSNEITLKEVVDKYQLGLTFESENVDDLIRAVVRRSTDISSNYSLRNKFCKDHRPQCFADTLYQYYKRNITNSEK